MEYIIKMLTFYEETRVLKKFSLSFSSFNQNWLQIYFLFVVLIKLLIGFIVATFLKLNLLEFHRFVCSLAQKSENTFRGGENNKKCFLFKFILTVKIGNFKFLMMLLKL